MNAENGITVENQTKSNTGYPNYIDHHFIKIFYPASFSVLIFSEDMKPAKDFEAMVNAYEVQNGEGTVLEASKGFLSLCGKDYTTARKNFFNGKSFLCYHGRKNVEADQKKI